MMMDRGEYLAGEEVTDLAQSKSKKETVVLSVRLTIQEFARLEAIANVMGKTVSQLAREAMNTYVGSTMPLGKPVVTVSLSGGATVFSGSLKQSSRAALGEKELAPLK